MDSILRVENIVKRYEHYKALDDVSISFPKGEIFGLLGPNGAGKTSLIRIINQITGPDEGKVFFLDQELKADHVKQIGYLPEERGLYKKMKVGEQAMYLAQLKGMSKHDAKKELNSWFQKFEIEGWWNKKVEELSKGMAQKVQFITTVLHKPELLILDEPFSGFDPINANLIKSEILKLKEEGTSIILSTHNMGSVEEICDHIALINSSKKILDGEIREIKSQYRTNIYDIEFKGNLIAFTNAMWAGFELLEKEQIQENHWNVKVKMLNNNNANSLLGAILEHVEIVAVNEEIPSMNDIFITAVQKKEEELWEK